MSKDSRIYGPIPEGWDGKSVKDHVNDLRGEIGEINELRDEIREVQDAIEQIMSEVLMIRGVLNLRDPYDLDRPIKDE
jgi:hypothetical protein